MYLEKRKKRNQYIYILIYTLLFIAFCLLAFHSFILENRTLIWTSDGLGQYVLNLKYLYTNILNTIKSFFSTGNLTFPVFAFDVGIGNDILSTYFVGILEYIGILFKRSNIEFTYTLISLIKMYCVGLSFLALCRYFKQNPIVSIVGSFIYIFSGYILYYGTRHPQFITPLILLPLFIISVDRLIRFKKFFMFTLLVFYSAWLDYYFLYINSILFGIYFLLVHICEKKNIKEFFKNSFMFFFNYIIGIGIAAVPFITKVSDFLSSPRTESTVSFEQLFLYKDNWSLKSFTRLFSPYIGSDYVEHYMLYALICISLITLIALFFFKDKKYKILKYSAILLTIFFIFPIFGYIFSGFSSIINRWSYAYVLLLSYIFVVVLPRLPELSKKQWIFLTYVFLAFVFLSIVEIIGYNELSCLISIIIMAITFIVLLITFKIIKIKEVNKLCIIALVLISLNVYVNGEYLFSKHYGNMASEFVLKGDVEAIAEDSLDYTASQIIDSTFFRTELFTNTQHLAGLSKYFNYNGTSIYDSTNDANIINYFRSVENIGNLTVGNYYNYDGRAFLESLANVKYFITSSGNEQYVPFGFFLNSSYPKSNRIDYVYENKYSLPIAFTYEYIIDPTLYNSLSAVEKQEVMLQGILIDKDSNKNKLVNPQISSIELEYEIISNDAEIKSNKIIAYKDNAVIRIEFPKQKNTETYLNIEGLNIDNVSDTSFQINLGSDDNVSKGIWVMTSDDFYKFDENNYLINLGYSEKGKSFCEIVLPKAGEYQFENLNVYSQKMDNLEFYTDKLKENSLQNISLSNNVITGTINLSKDKILCFSIPYSDNWLLEIDGEVVDTFKGNEMFLAANISKGNHSIKLRYVSKALQYGLPISIISILILLVELIFINKKRIKD